MQNILIASFCPMKYIMLNHVLFVWCSLCDWNQDIWANLNDPVCKNEKCIVNISSVEHKAKVQLGNAYESY